MLHNLEEEILESQMQKRQPLLQISIANISRVSLTISMGGCNVLNSFLQCLCLTHVIFLIKKNNCLTISWRGWKCSCSCTGLCKVSNSIKWKVCHNLTLTLKKQNQSGRFSSELFLWSTKSNLLAWEVQWQTGSLCCTGQLPSKAVHYLMETGLL